MPLSQNMTRDELLRFRTKKCPRKSSKGVCELEERCPFSHCLSWNRRHPIDSVYRPTLCPDVHFRMVEGKMRVRNFCRRGRVCSYCHTKEEQMYHPLVYKTQLCRDWPQCSKAYCPFGEREGREEREYCVCYCCIAITYVVLFVSPSYSNVSYLFLLSQLMAW